MTEPITYKRLPSGRIDWKGHLNVKYIRVKDDKKGDVERQFGKNPDLSTVPDYYLYVTLGGYNEVARLRGFDSLVHHVDFVDHHKAVVTCTMHFVPNDEEPNGLTCSGVASGSVHNINPDFTPFMETIAENRAFVRCVRRALNINIVAQEELGMDKTKNETSAGAPPLPDAAPSDTERTGFDALSTLVNQCKAKNISFNDLKARAMDKPNGLTDNPVSWVSFDSIQHKDVYVLLGKLAAAPESNADKVAKSRV